MIGIIGDLIFGLGIFFLIIWLLFFIAFLLCIVFWGIMIVDVVNRKFAKSEDKTLWVLVVVFAGIIGALIYYFMVKKKDTK